MMRVWPFRPGSEMTESLEWRTDVMRAAAAEERVSLRSVPRRTWALAHLFTAREYAAAQELVRAAEEFLVPDWAESVRLQGVPAGQAVAIAFDAACHDFAPGDAAILWHDVDAWERIEIVSAGETGVVAAQVLREWAPVRLMPLRRAVAPGGIEAQRITHRYAAAQVEMRVLDNVSDPASNYPQYRGLDVMTDCPKLAGSTLEESIAWPVEIVDGHVGTFRVFRDRAMPDAVFTMRWQVFDRCEYRALRRWLYSRKGRRKSFWLSSRNADFTPLVDLGSADDSIVVRPLLDAELLSPARESFDIEVVTAGGDSIRREVAEWEIDSDGRLVLSFDAAVGMDVAIGAVRRISYLRRVRFNADRIEISHRAGAGKQIAVPCIEIDSSWL